MKTTKESADRNAYVRFFDWLDSGMFRALGTDESALDTTTHLHPTSCPICAHPMDEHRIDHSTANTALICPEPPLPLATDQRALNEMGMPTPRAQEKLLRTAH